MNISFLQRTVLMSAAVFFLASACGTRAPFLKPDSPGTEPSAADQVVAEVKPVDTSGFQNEERKRLGIDLSAYFTAFEVTIRNRTPNTVTLEGRGAQLVDDEQRTYKVLTANQSLDYYQSGGISDDKIVIVSKTIGVAKEEMEKILELRLRDMEIPSGGSGTGYLLFKKVPSDKCHRVSLTLTGIHIPDKNQNPNFTFGFSCPES